MTRTNKGGFEGVHFLCGSMTVKTKYVYIYMKLKSYSKPSQETCGWVVGNQSEKM